MIIGDGTRRGARRALPVRTRCRSVSDGKGSEGRGRSRGGKDFQLRARAAIGEAANYWGSSTALTQSQWTAAFSKRLRELGWIEGRNVAIDYR
jgi:hypothetical protein